MKESNPLSFRTNPGFRIDQPYSRRSAASQDGVQIIHSKAYVVNAGPPLRDELSNRSIIASRLQQLDKRISRGECLDPRTVGIVDRYRLQAEYVAIKGKRGVKRLESDSNVRNPDAMGG